MIALKCYKTYIQESVRKNVFYVKHVTTTYVSNSPSNNLMVAGKYVENIDFLTIKSLTEFSVQVLRTIKIFTKVMAVDQYDNRKLKYIINNFLFFGIQCIFLILFEIVYIIIHNR